MATKTLVSLDEYLATSYEPDVDGGFRQVDALTITAHGVSIAVGQAFA